MNVLVFDLWGDYAHYKKIYATTSAISYAIPPKTSLYGMFWAIAPMLEEFNKDIYLTYFQDKNCLVGIGLQRPIVMQRINTNLVSRIGRMRQYNSKGKRNTNRKPTTMEFVVNPKYRIYFYHTDNSLYNYLKHQLKTHKAIYSPTLGIAGLHANFSYAGEQEAVKSTKTEPVKINSVIPKSKFLGFDEEGLYDVGNEIVEQSMYAVEMDTKRNVTERDDILLDRKANPIPAKVTDYYTLENGEHVVLF